ncbi:hypothetical protein HOE22_01380 [Candidatus Woesearchaeota archaeon]|jgi:hypothetical protein|nr:hypothetical protein [Candidatus Woesearchaeota archaeon]
MKQYLPKWWSVVVWIIIAVALCGTQLNGQTYTEGDYVLGILADCQVVFTR